MLNKIVDTWREAGYPCEEYPLISEILEWCYEPETGTSRFLRKPQIRALETYWYLRLVEKTPHIFALYKKYYPKIPQLLNELGFDNQNIKDYVLEPTFRRSPERNNNFCSVEILSQNSRTDDRKI